MLYSAKHLLLMYKLYQKIGTHWFFEVFHKGLPISSTTLEALETTRAGSTKCQAFFAGNFKIFNTICVIYGPFVVPLN